jgi:hypothetical protein
MFPLDVEENLVVVGTAGFIRFIEDLKDQGITFRKSDLGRPGTRGLAPLIIEIDDDKTPEKLHELDIPLPVLVHQDQSSVQL